MAFSRIVACIAALAGMVVSLVAVAFAPVATPTDAASHREAPLIAMDPEADITDFFMFRSYEPGKADKLILLMDVIPGEEPSSGPNYYYFDPNVLYTIHIDNDADGRADDVTFELRFRTEIRGVVDQLDLFLSYVALPPITALDGPGSEGLGLRQRYSVTMNAKGRSQQIGDGFIAVPSNVGPRTMPNYETNLAQKGIYTLGNGMRVFAGQRDDPFYIDLGAVFDTLNLRNPGVDMLSGFNVHTIALEVPISLITRDGKGATDTSQPKIGAYASTSRQSISVLREDIASRIDIGKIRSDLAALGVSIDANIGSAGGRDINSGPWVQVQRLANPLVNEVIIGTEDKDRWNRLRPDQESVFLDYYLNPRLAVALQAVFGAPAPTSNRQDLVNILLKYAPTDTRLSELLRLDLRVEPRPLAQQQRLTALAGDNAGWPNGRRPIDDVTDVAVRVVGGVLIGNTNYANAGDNVNGPEPQKPFPTTFPLLASPWDGRNRIHQNP